MNKLITKIVGAALGLTMAVGVGVAVASNRETVPVHAVEGDELAVCEGQGSGYGTRRTYTDSHDVGWVLSTGQSGYLGTNNSTNHGKVKPTAADLPVVKALNSSATTNTTGYYFYYTTTAVSNVGALEFSQTAASAQRGTGYVVRCDTAAAASSKTWEEVEMDSQSDDDNGADVFDKDVTGYAKTSTFTFSETETGSYYYGFIIVTSSNTRYTTGTIKLLEGSTSDSPLASISVTTPPTNTKYLIGETFDPTGMVVTGKLEDDTDLGDVTSNCTFTPPDMSSVGTKNVSISFTLNDVEKTTTQSIEIRSIKNITGASTKPTTLKVGQQLKTSDVALTATCDDDTNYWSTLTPTSVSCNTSVATTVEATATYGGASGTKTYSWNITVEEADPGTEYNPFTVTQAIAHIDSVIEGGTSSGNDGTEYYVSGIVSSFYSTSVSSGKISFYISDDGSTTTEFEAFGCKSFNNQNFSALSDVLIGDKVTLYGQIKKYVSSSSVVTYETTGTNYLHEQTHVSSLAIATAPTKTEYEAGEAFDGSGLVLTVNYVGKASNSITYGSNYADAVTFTPSGSLTKDDNKVTISYGGQTVNQTITVVTVPVVNSISIEPDSVLMNLNDSTTVSAVIDKDEGATLNLKWITSNSTYASISGSGTTITITGGASEGNATITAFDDKNDNGIVDAGEQSGTCAVTVKEIQMNFFYKLSSTDSLTAGDKIVIVAHNTNDYLMTATSLSSGKASAVQQAMWDSSTCFRTDLISYGFTVGGDSTNGYTLKNSANSYLKYVSSTNLGLEATDSPTDAHKWTIATGGTGGTFTVTNKGTTDRAVIYRNTGIFGAYKNTNHDGSEYFDVEIYRLVDPTVLTLSGCNNAGSFGGDWDSLSEAFSHLSDAEKAYYKHATYSISRSGSETTVTPTNGTKPGVATYLAKYDYIIEKYNTQLVTAYTDFIGRVSAGMVALRASASNGIFGISSDSASTTTIIVIISLVGLTAIGGYFFIKKRKEQQ